MYVCLSALVYDSVLIVCVRVLANHPLAAPTDFVSGTLGAMEWMFFEIDISQEQMCNDIDMFA